jgi:membrane protein involved in colicin uptake
MNDDKNLYPLIISLILHIIFIYVFFFGLPNLFKPLPADNRVVTVEILPITEFANIKTKKAQKDKKIESENSKKVEKSKSEQKQESEHLEDKTQKVEPVKKPEDKPKQESLNKDIVKIKEKEKPKPKEKEKPKPTKQKDEDKKKNQTKDNKQSHDSDLDSLLKTLEQSSEGNKDAKTKQKARSESNEVQKEAEGIFDEQQAESIDYKNLLKKQIEENWNPPIGVVDKNFAVKFNIRYNIDGTLIDYKLIDKDCTALDSGTCISLINNAQRAIAATNPIKHVDPARYSEWSEINYTFTPESFR